MTISMTGFGRAYSENDEIQVKIEMKSVNSRYNDLSIKLPRIYSFAEEKLKKLIKNEISRGKIDVYINIYNISNSNVNINVDMELANKYYSAVSKIKSKFNIKEKIRVDNIVLIPGVINIVENEVNEDKSFSIIESVFTVALNELMKMKITEGNHLKKDMLIKINELKENLNLIKKESPVVINEYKEKLQVKLNEILEDSNIDEYRLNQEVAYLIDKAGIDEEIIRLESHITQFENNLLKDNTGRKLDFIVQEMNREVNTIGSKANSLNITNSVLDCKCIIEKLREQAMNIE